MTLSKTQFWEEVVAHGRNEINHFRSTFMVVFDIKSDWQQWPVQTWQWLLTNEYMNAHMGRSLTKLIFTVCEQHRIQQNKRMCSRRIWGRSMQMSLGSAHKTEQQHLFSILSHLHEDWTIWKPVWHLLDVYRLWAWLNHHWPRPRPLGNHRTNSCNGHLRVGLDQIK